MAHAFAELRDGVVARPARKRSPHATSRARKATSHTPGFGTLPRASAYAMRCIRSRKGEPQATLLRRLRQPTVPSLSPR
eukprot:scaffold58402_cov42-Phaeocystis_antarctica.AAC.2